MAYVRIHVILKLLYRRMSYFIDQSKKIYYSEQGFGKPVVLLHGDTASSKMFEPLLPLYTEAFKVILIDFFGNGKSDRVEDFPEEYPLLEDFLYDAIYIPEGMESCTYYPKIVLSCKAGLLTGTPSFKQLCRLQKQNPYIREKILRKAIGSVWPGMP